MFNDEERYAYFEKEMNKEINDLNNFIRSLDSRMTKAESKRDSLKIALSNTQFTSETCFDNSTTSIGFPLAACPEVTEVRLSTTSATQRNLKRRESKDTYSGISPGSIRQQQSNHATFSERSPEDCPRQ